MKVYVYKKKNSKGSLCVCVWIYTRIPEWCSTVSTLEQVRPVPSDLCCLLIYGKYGADKWLKKERQKSLLGMLQRIW